MIFIIILIAFLFSITANAILWDERNCYMARADGLKKMYNAAFESFSKTCNDYHNLKETCNKLDVENTRLKTVIWQKSTPKRRSIKNK